MRSMYAQYSICKFGHDSAFLAREQVTRWILLDKTPASLWREPHKSWPTKLYLESVGAEDRGPCI